MSIEVGHTAKDFTCNAVSETGSIIEGFNFFEATKDQYALLFFYPLDFTFVCPTEMIALHKRMPLLKKLGTRVMTVSIDSEFSHLRWRETPVNQGGIGPVDYTMLADVSHQICREYGVEHSENHVAYRASIIIDKNRKVCAKHVNDLPVGRNIDEIVRTIQAIQYHEKHGEVCQAGWQDGRSGFQADQEGISSFLTAHAEAL